MRLGYERFTGDGESSSLEINNEMVLEYNDWDENCIDPIVECSQFPFSDIVQSKNKTQLIKQIQTSFYPEYCDNYWDEDNEDEDSDSFDPEEERSNRKFDESMGMIKEDFEGIQSIKSMNSAEATYVFSGRGEFLASPDEIVEKMFVASVASQVNKFASEIEDTEELAQALKTIQELKIYSDASLEALAEFLINCDYAPDECTVKQHYNNGKIEMQIDWN